MDLVYSTVWETEKKPKRSDLCGKVAIDWSSRNLIAFASGYKTIRNDGDDKHIKQYLNNPIHIFDPDSPWEINSFDSKHHLDIIKQVLWHSSGSKLLSIDVAGKCCVWTMKDHLINDWKCETVSDVGEGEQLVAVSWIDNGIKVRYTPTDDQLGAISRKSFEEQFKLSSNKPPYTEFGGKAHDGWVSVTESGLICVTTTKPEIKTIRQSLSLVRHRIAVADLAYTNQGKVLVAANDGNKSTAVQFYRVQIKPLPKNNCQIETFSLPCLFPHSRSELQQVKEYIVSDIQFLSKNSGEIVLVCTVGPFGTYIKRWDMKKEKVEKFSKTPFRTQTGNQPVTFRWSCCASYMDSSQMISMALPWLPFGVLETSQMMTTSQLITFPSTALAVSYTDGRIELINSHSLLPMTNNLKPQVIEPASKKAKTSTGSHLIGNMSAMHFSPCCCCLLGVTLAGDISLFKLVHHSTDSMAMNRMKRSLVDLLEYCFVTGWEWWDVLLVSHFGTTSDTVESVLKQLFDEFNQQQVYQQYSSQHMLIPKVMSFKASLYRCMKDGSGQAMDCYAAQFLYAVAMFLRSLPSCPHSTIEHLTKTCTLVRTSEMDIDKYISPNDAKEYAVDGVILTAVRPLIQWITDLAMFIIAAFTTRHSKDSVPGVSLGRNHEVLGILKEMLVLIRLWGQSMPFVVPSITPSADKKDSLALLFKLITKMWLHCKQPSEGQEFEDRLAAEASPLLPNQLLTLNMKAPNLNRGVTGKPVSGPVKPVIYQFNNKPTGSSVCHSYHPFASAVLPVAPDSPHYLDVIRRVFIDSDVRLRQCTRCRCVSQLDGPVSQSSVLTTWEQRWIKTCYCGGSWKKYSVKDNT